MALEIDPLDADVAGQLDGRAGGGRQRQQGKGRAVQGDVYLEKQEDDRWRTSQLLPDEELTVTVAAKGFKTHTQKLKLAEGMSKDLTPVLEKE